MSISAFGIDHGEVSKAYYHASQAKLNPGDVLQTATARGHNTDHLPDDEKWRNDRIWMTRRKRKAKKWAGKGSKAYKVEPTPDVQRHKKTKYDGFLTGRQYHASGASVK